MSLVVAIFLFIIFSLLLFITVFALASFGDLETDYINPIDLCNNLNQFVLPEYIGQAVATALLLINGSWLPLVLNIALLVYHFRRFQAREHLLDSTSVFQSLPIQKKCKYTMLGFYVINFFFGLYNLIMAAVNQFLGEDLGEGLNTMAEMLVKPGFRSIMPGGLRRFP